MNVWIVFLFGSFLLGSLGARRNRPERPILVLVGCAVVCTLFLFERFA